MAGQGQLPWVEERWRVQLVLSSRWEQAYPAGGCPGWRHGNRHSALSSAPPNAPWLPSPLLQERTIHVGQEATTAAAAHSHCRRVRSLPLQPAALSSQPWHTSLSSFGHPTLRTFPHPLEDDSPGKRPSGLKTISVLFPRNATIAPHWV